MADDSFPLFELLEDIFPSTVRVTLTQNNPFDTYDEKKFKERFRLSKGVVCDIFTPHERAILFVFCHPTVVGARRSFPPKMGDQCDSPPFENRSCRQITMNSLDGARVRLSDGIIIILVICYGDDHYTLFV